jgi:hypothetical protein
MKAVRPCSTRKRSGTEAGSKLGGFASFAVTEQLNSVAATSINERMIDHFFPVAPICRQFGGPHHDAP